jgi:prepilin-type N-terminal cleavage/methylation domain-containing protein
METNMTRIKAALERRMAEGKREEGFSLIELLVVVIIIGILAAIAIPIYIGVQDNAKDSAVKSDLTNAKLAVIAYYTDKGATAAAPTLDATLTGTGLGNYGFTQSSNTTSLAFKTAATSTAFCIDAVGVTTHKFSVSANGGVVNNACP